MKGVGPAGRWFIALRERGRRIVIRIGGRRRVGGRMLMRNDCYYVNLGMGFWQDRGDLRRTYGSPINAQ